MARDRAHPEISLWRLLPLWAGMLALFGVLGFRLWNLQVAQGTEYQRRLAKQSLRSVRVPGIRGRILDRRGERLADNRPSYCVSLYVEELRRPGGVQRTVDSVLDTLDRIAETMDRPRQRQAQDVRLHISRRTPLPLVAWKDLDETAVARIVDRARRLESEADGHGERAARVRRHHHPRPFAGLQPIVDPPRRRGQPLVVA